MSGLVGLVDQVGAALSGSDQPDQQGGAEVADTVYGVVVDRCCADPGEQLVDEIIDLGVVAGEASHRIGQPRRGAQCPAIQPIRSLGDGDVFPKVADQFDQGDVGALRPGVQTSGRGAANACSSALIDSDNSARRTRNASMA